PCQPIQCFLNLMGPSARGAYTDRAYRRCPIAAGAACAFESHQVQSLLVVGAIDIAARLTETGNESLYHFGVTGFLCHAHQGRDRPPVGDDPLECGFTAVELLRRYPRWNRIEDNRRVDVTGEPGGVLGGVHVPGVQPGSGAFTFVGRIELFGQISGIYTREVMELIEPGLLLT